MVGEAKRSVVAAVSLWLLALVVPVIAAVAVVATNPTWSATSVVVSSSRSPGGASSASTIVIKDFAFSPRQVRVAPGTKVSVTNEDSTTHTFTAAGGQFDTNDLHPGRDAVIVAPTKPGVYRFMCSIHPNMTGTLVVAGP